MAIWMDGKEKEIAGEQVNGWIDGWMVRWVDSWIREWRSRQMDMNR